MANMTKKTKRMILITYLFICMILIGIFSIISDVSIINKNTLVITTFAINGILILSQVFRKTKLGYSMNDIVFISLSIFMFMAPLIQYLADQFPWWDTMYLTDDIILHTNIIILIFMLGFILTYNVRFYKPNRLSKDLSSIKNIEKILKLFSFFTILCSIYIIAKTGFPNLFSRSTNIIDINSSSISLIVTNTFRAIPILTVALNLAYRRICDKFYNKVYIFIVAILALIVNFPVATARFWMAAVYIGLFISIKKRFNNPHAFKILIYFGILFIFPLINAFRHNTFSEVITNGIRIPGVAKAFLQGDFDAFSMLARTIIYTSIGEISLGFQLLGNTLFFIPRTLWQSKPVGSGVVVANHFQWEFTNVSEPFIAEGYINFGILGVILFSVGLAFIAKKADEKYREFVVENKKNVTFIEIIYPFSIGFLFFILRGDLLSSLSYYIGFMMPVFVIYIIDNLIDVILINKKIKFL